VPIEEVEDLERKAAENGVGIVQLPHYMVREQLSGGHLVQVASDWEATQGIIHAVFSSRRGQPVALRPLLDFSAQAFEEANA